MFHCESTHYPSYAHNSLVEFDLSKIEKAIKRAFIAEHKPYTDGLITTIALKVTADFSKKVVNDVISVEDIQDSVENVLIEIGYVDVAKSYMIYRKQHENLRDMKSTELDYKKTVDSYLKVSDSRCHADAPL